MSNEHISYDADSIQVLSDIDHIKLRKGMYIGEANNPHHLFSEIYDNAIDEIQNGYGDHIDVNADVIHNTYTVRDYGRGLPQDNKILEDGRSMNAIEVIYTISNAGGKFDGKSYNYSSGLHGVGSTVVNALSELLQVTSYRDGNQCEFIFENGAKISSIENQPTDEPNGTKVIFKPNLTYFESPKIPEDYLIDRCKIASAFGMKTNLTLNGEEIDTSSDIFDLMYQEEESGVSEYSGVTFKVKSPDSDEQCVIALKYTSETDYHYSGFTNLVPNQLGGSHYKMLDRCIEKAWSKYNVEGIKSSDLYLGIRAVVAVFISEPEFSSQTKEKLSVDKSKLTKFEPLIEAEIIKWLDSDEALRLGLIKKFQDYRDSRNKMMSKKEIRSLIYVNENTTGEGLRRKSVVTKLRECTSTSRDGTTLFICLAGDTKVKLLDGTTPTIEELSHREDPFWVYSLDSSQRFIPAKAHDARITQYVDKMIKLTLSDGSVIRCTPEHRFMDRDTNSWVMAKDLAVGQSLTHLSTFINNNGYEMIYDPVDAKYHTTHTVVNLVINHQDYDQLNATKEDYPVTHHSDFNKLNNSPTNLKWMTKNTHIPMHAEHGRKILTDYNKSDKHRDSMRRAWSDPQKRKLMSEGVNHRSAEGIMRQKESIRKANQDGRMKNFSNSNSTYLGSAKHHEDCRKIFINHPEYRERAGNELRKINSDPDMKIIQLRSRIGKLIRDCLDKYGEFTQSSYEKLRLLHNHSFINYTTILKYFDNYEQAEEYGRNYNYKVVSIEIEELSQPIPVYCLTVDSESHAFALDNGLITHNCEGDSAMGSILACRDPRYHAVMPLRGKVLNVSKCDITTSMKNEEVRSIVNSIGTGIYEECDASKSRYSRIVIVGDADPDGDQIAALVIGMIVNMLPEVVKAGMLYVSHPPLYGWMTKSGQVFSNDRSEVPNGVPFTRYKGLGEMNPDEMFQSVVNFDTCIPYTQVQYPEDLALFNTILTSASFKYQMLHDLGLIKYVE